ncbi:MAG: glycosyltransferase family 2 protein [Myxococcales bacterium]|nr:glycosyltransferase family 2 protein [Myxococcales bacterium]MDH5305858.1 glycosyltransferase family 2 protein [Myxococcales bacterium]MDH5565648.1 glycosyltransferase family 2 protein [Myxococcales bacterium]
MDVSVAICTWNRARLLDRTLAELRALRVPEGLAWEVLVVDNASSDDTAAIAARHAGALPLRAVREAQRGLSHARNRAIREARGALLAWTDDDVLVAHDWLAAYTRAAHELPDAAFFGGPILPEFEASPPAWIEAALPVIGSAFALCDWRDERAALDAGHLPFGANFAVRSAVQRRYLFDPELGRRGGELLSGDENEVFRRMLADGHAGWWLPEARVRHLVTRDRMTLEYLRRYYRGIGRSHVRARGPAPGPRYARMLESAAKACLKAMRSRLRRRLGVSPAWLEDLRDANIHWGRFEALRDAERRAASSGDRAREAGRR